MTIDPSEAVTDSIRESTLASSVPMTLDMAYQNAYEMLYRAVGVTTAFMEEPEWVRVLEEARERVAAILETELRSIFGHNAFETFEARPRPLE